MASDTHPQTTAPGTTAEPQPATDEQIPPQDAEVPEGLAPTGEVEDHRPEGHATDPTRSEVWNDEQEADRATLPHPDSVQTALAWLQVATVAALLNLGVYALAQGVGGSMTADVGVATFDITLVSVIAATYGVLLVAVAGWAVVAHRVPGFATVWVPLVLGAGLVSLGGAAAAGDTVTGVALGAMHAVVVLVIAFWVPRRLPR